MTASSAWKWREQINELLHALHLSHVETSLPDLYEQARLHGLTYEAFLRRVLLLEVEGRKLVAQHKRLQGHAFRRAKPWKRSISRFSPRSMSGCCGNWQTSPSSKRKPILCFWAHRAWEKHILAIALCVKAFWRLATVFCSRRSRTW